MEQIIYADKTDGISIDLSLIHISEGPGSQE